MWFTLGCFDLAPLVLKPTFIPTEILIIIIIDIYDDEDRLVAIRYDAPLDKALEPTYKLSLSSLLHCLTASLPSPPCAPPLRGRRLGAFMCHPQSGGL